MTAEPTQQPAPVENLWTAPAPTPYASVLEHLANRIDRIRDLVAAYVLRQPADERRSRDVDRAALFERTRLWGTSDVPSETRALWEVADRKLAWMKEREALTAATGLDLPLLRLASAFGLSEVDLDILVLAAAPQVDPMYCKDWQPIDRDACDPDVRFALGVLAKGFEESIMMRRIFSVRAPLQTGSIVLFEGCFGASECDWLNLSLEVPRRIVSELLGEAAFDDELVAFSRLRRPEVPLDQVVLPAETKALVLSLVKNHERFLERRKEWGIDEVVTYGRGLVMLFEGSPGTGKTMLAHAVAHEVGKRLFCIDFTKLVERGRSLETNLDSVFREARLLDAVLFFDECEQIFASRKAGNGAMPTLLTRLESFDGIAILATNMSEMLDDALARRIFAKVTFTEPTPRARIEIWRKHLPPALPLAPDVDLEKLATDYELTGGYIKNAVLTAVVRATAAEAEIVTMADLEHGARLQVRSDPGTVARIVQPDARLEHVVLPDDVRAKIDRFIAGAKVRSTVLAEWGFARTLGRGNGVAALFSGPSGTGKSMTAEAVAAALERPLLRCPLPTVMSKYVGDTARHLERLFREAADQRAVLVFDEADALFARRVSVSTAQDRFANGESAALLGEMESFRGVVILTTNLATELDPAFARRFSLHVEFPLPDARGRAAIWRSLLPKDAPVAPDVDVTDLAMRFVLTGAQIRNAVLEAALEAASLVNAGGKGRAERRIEQRMLVDAAAAQAPEREAERVRPSRLSS